MEIEEKKDSFGEYFDTQYNNLRKSLENKNAQLWKEWKEEHESEKNKNKEKQIRKNSENVTGK